MSTVIDERFEIRRRLGAGGMGEVFEAFDRKRDETIALKTLRHPNPASLYNFKKEFRSLQDVSHPNLVSLYELVVDKDQWFFTMELIEGESLKDYIYPLDQTMPITLGNNPDLDMAPPLDIGRLRKAMRQLASGVKAVHDAGRLHRDLKPSNIMVTKRGRVVILDFGVAIELTPVLNLRSVDSGIAGTAAYMAPEQARGEPARPASDWYAVGVILFEILTGHWPFTGSLARILIDKQFQPAPSVGSLVPGLPPDLVELTMALLEPEPDERPDGAEILSRFGGGDESGVITSPMAAAVAAGTQTSLVGRQSHFDQLEDAFNLTQDGQGVTVHVHGLSGIGKTALIHEFLNTLVGQMQAVVLPGRCYEHEMVPYKALDGLVDSLSRYLRTLRRGLIQELLPRRIDALARLFPVLMRVDAVAAQADSFSETGRQTFDLDNPDRAHLRRQAIHALRQLLQHIVSLQPLVLFVDDLQWADDDSARMLTEVMAPPEAPPILLVTSFRSEAVTARPFLRQFLGDVDGVHHRQLSVDALSDQSAAGYVRKALGSKPGTHYLVEMIVRESRGVPFFLEQLTRHAMGSTSGVSAGLSLVEMLEERLQTLPPGGAALLNVLAAASRPVDATVATRAAGVGGDERRLLALLKAACLVRANTASASTASGQIELYHDRIREALLARLSKAEIRRTHARLLAALEARSDGDPEMLLEQAHRAENRVKAALWAERAAEKAASALAYERAAELYRRARELGEDPVKDIVLRERLADTLAAGGRTREAADLHLELTHAHAGLEALRYRRIAAMEFLMSGYVDRGLEVAGDLLEALGISEPTSQTGLLATLLWERWRLKLRGFQFNIRQEAQIPAKDLLRVDTYWSMASGLVMADTTRALLFQARHLNLALEVGEPHRVARALAFEVGLRATPGRASRLDSEKMYERAVELAHQIDNGYAAALAMMMRGISFYLNGEWRSALQVCDQAEVMFLDCSGTTIWEVVTARRFALTCLAFLGDLRQVSERLPTQLEEARERGNIYGLNELRTRLNLYWLAEDDTEQAEREIEQATSNWSRRGYHLWHYRILAARAELDLYRGRGRSALARLEDEWPRLENSLLPRIRTLRVESFGLKARGLLAAARETPESARPPLLRQADKISRRIQRQGLAFSRPLSGLLRAGVAHLRGQNAATRQALEDAAADFEASGMALHAEAARRRLGELMKGDAGRERRERADAAMRKLGVHHPERMTGMLAPGFS